MNFAGSILAEPTFADSLDNVLLYMDVYDDYNSALYEMPISIFASYYDTYFSCDSTAYFCEFTKDSKSKQRKINPVSFDVLEKAMKDKIKEFFVPLIKPSVEKGTKSIVEYPAFTARFPHSLDLYPGTYTVYFQAIRKDLYEANGTISEIAKADSMQFIIPQWKMKLRKDEWYQDKVPYTEIKEYEKTKIMQVILWRPWFWGPYEPLNLNIVRETDSVTVQNFVVDFNTKAAYDLLEWEIPEATVPGFYDVKADNLDYHFNINVNQEIITQVCPIYLSWENGGSWPDNWPGSNNADWEMHLSSSWTPALGAYALGAVYFPEGNTGKVELEKTGIAIESEWDRVLEFAIGLQKTIGTNDFDVLMAHFSVATSTDGANWTIEKTADLSEYTPVAWNPDKQHCFIKTFKPLGKVTNLGIKFIKEGFTSSELDSNIVLFDEVKVDFTKTPLKTGPTDPSAQYAGGNVNVGWSGAAKVDKALDNYYVYRNGIKIGETTTVTFVDSTVSANTFYNYAITAHYDDGSLLPESPMNECSISIYTGLYSPSNLVITNENPNIKLTWSPVSGASEYKVYSSNDPYGTFAEDTSGTFNGEEWIAPLSSSRLFYYVVAVNESMKEKRILKESSNRVK
ncbi:TPA: hypothetical protein DCR49_00995 [Candidatus Delongbacteria bacterium]|nr:hypothetical protein [Candidatus Delongbacteria bacterium]